MISLPVSGEFPCPRLKAFNADGKPHHGEAIRNLELLIDGGEEKWLADMAAKWTCPRCGEKKSWYRKNCRCP
jgi:hypothetical protein